MAGNDKSSASWIDILSAVRESFPDASSDASSGESQPETVSYPESGRLDISLEKKGRGGKTATIIAGFTSFSDNQLREFASGMKQRLGTGGSARGNEILIQGDRRQDVLKYLVAAGFKARII